MTACPASLPAADCAKWYYIFIFDTVPNNFLKIPHRGFRKQMKIDRTQTNSESVWFDNMCAATQKNCGDIKKRWIWLGGICIHATAYLLFNVFITTKATAIWKESVPARFITLLSSPWNTSLCFEHWRTCVANAFTLFVYIFLGFELSVKYKFFISQISLINFKTGF